MSVPLMWKPINEKKQIGYNLRRALMKKLWPKDDFLTPVHVDRSWIGYFHGLADAGLPEAQELIDALAVYEKIEFTLEN
jgi:hypothetical protein